jgi:MFS family permease
VRRPWWIPPVLGRVPEIEPRLLRVLGLVSLALFFESYDVSMLTSALPDIARSLGIAEGQLGGHLAAIRLGALPGLAIVPLIDRLGRRRLFLASVAGVGVCTFLTGFAQTAAQFVAAQMVTRTFFLVCTAVASVIVTEEFPAETRGWGIGMLGALSACGFGLGALLFAVVDRLPYGWRALYGIGLVPLLLLPQLAREVGETDRFRRMHRRDHARGPAAWVRPLVELARAYPLRALGLTLAAGLFAIGETSVFQFTGWFTQEKHHWTRPQYAAMVVVGGAIGVLGNVAAGALGDRIGRRAVGAMFIGAFPAFAWLFYRGPESTITVAWTLFIFCETAGITVIRAFSTELFPTSHRGTAAGWIGFVQTLCWAGGLWIVGLGTKQSGDIERLTSALSLTALPAAAVLLALPETRRRELERISAEP